MSEHYHLPGVPFCVVLLSYDGAQEKIEAAMPEHIAWLTKAYDDGTVLLSGRRTPWTGGVLLCRGDQAQAEALMAKSPWVAQGLASAEIVGFSAGMAASALRDALI